MPRHIPLYTLCLAVMITLTVTGHSIRALSYPLDPYNPVALYGPPVVKITVSYGALFEVPYPEFHGEGGRFTFTPQPEFSSEEVEASWSGTGFIITPDGHLLTNAHIAGSEYYKRYGFLVNHACEITDLFIGDQLIMYEHYELFFQSYYRYLLDFGNFTLERETITVSFGGEFFPARPIAMGDPIGRGASDDVALLKAEAPTDTFFPTLKLGDSTETVVDDPVVIPGFPEAFTGDMEKPQFVTGKIVDLKEMGELTVFQTDAHITFGYSGGPALNRDGEAIGIASFGALSPFTDEMTNFLIPIHVAQSHLDRVSVMDERGILDECYERGLKYLWGGEYSASIPEFTMVLDMNPYHRYAQYYLNHARQEAEKREPSITETTLTILDSREPRVIGETTTTTTLKQETEMKTGTTATIRREPASISPLSSMIIVSVVIVITIIILTSIFVMKFQHTRSERSGKIRFHGGHAERERVLTLI